MRKARNDTTRPPAAAAPRVCHLQMRTLGCRAAASEHPRQLEPTTTAGSRDRKLGAFPFGNEAAVDLPTCPSRAGFPSLPPRPLHV